MKPYFSVVIPTLNEQNNIENLLIDLRNQTYSNLEIIVVDGGSEDKTVTMAKKFKVKVVVYDQGGVANQRNIGAYESNGTYILFMDADNYLDINFLEKLKSRIERNNPDAFTCYVNNNLSLLKERLTANFLNFYIHLSHIFFSPGAIGACIGCKREVFCKNTEFVQSLVPFEDGAFVRNMSRLGYKCSIFNNPKFGYSLRRYRENGYLNTLVNYFVLGLKSKVFKHDLNLNVDYKMGGKLQDK